MALNRLYLLVWLLACHSGFIQVYRGIQFASGTIPMDGITKDPTTSRRKQREFGSAAVEDRNPPKLHVKLCTSCKFGQTVASITNIAWFGGIGLLFGGTGLFKTFEMAEPRFYVTMKSNPVAAFAGLFLMNSLGASLLSTGAFEVYLDETLIFSKLEVGRMPTVDDIRASLKAYGLKEED